LVLLPAVHVGGRARVPVPPLPRAGACASRWDRRRSHGLRDGLAVARALLHVPAARRERPPSRGLPERRRAARVPARQRPALPGRVLTWRRRAAPPISSATSPPGRSTTPPWSRRSTASTP